MAKTETDRVEALIAAIEDADNEAEAEGRDPRTVDAFEVIQAFFGKPLEKLSRAEQADVLEALGYRAEMAKREFELWQRSMK